MNAHDNGDPTGQAIQALGSPPVAPEAHPAALGHRAALLLLDLAFAGDERVWPHVDADVIHWPSILTEPWAADEAPGIAVAAHLDGALAVEKINLGWVLHAASPAVWEAVWTAVDRLRDQFYPPADHGVIVQTDAGRRAETAAETTMPGVPTPEGQVCSMRADQFRAHDQLHIEGGPYRVVGRDEPRRDPHLGPLVDVTLRIGNADHLRCFEVGPLFLVTRPGPVDDLEDVGEVASDA